jgi:hypothetical protein
MRQELGAVKVDNNMLKLNKMSTISIMLADETKGDGVSTCLRKKVRRVSATATSDCEK